MVVNWSLTLCSKRCFTEAQKLLQNIFPYTKKGREVAYINLHNLVIQLHTKRHLSKLGVIRIKNYYNRTHTGWYTLNSTDVVK